MSDRRSADDLDPRARPADGGRVHGSRALRSRPRLLRPRGPAVWTRGRFFYQRRRRAALRRAPRDPARRDGGTARARAGRRRPASRFDLVEAGAGNGRLSADILRAARGRDPALYDRIRLHLVEASAAARAAQRTRSAMSPSGWSASSPTLPAPSRACWSPTSCSTRCRCTRS